MKSFNIILIEYHALGDKGYPLLDYFITPLADAHGEQEQRFNQAHIKTRYGGTLCGSFEGEVDVSWACRRDTPVLSRKSVPHNPGLFCTTSRRTTVCHLMRSQSSQSQGIHGPVQLHLGLYSSDRLSSNNFNVSNNIIAL